MFGLEARKYMSDAVSSFQVLHSNPFVFGPLFPAFASELGIKKNGFLLGYLVLPFCLQVESRGFLERANSASSIRTLSGDSSRLFGLEQRIFDFTALTNESIQYSINVGALSLDEDLALVEAGAWAEELIVEPNLLKAAKRLGKIFAPHDVLTVCRTLGIQRL